jgi:hypothetical protein
MSVVTATQLKDFMGLTSDPAGAVTALNAAEALVATYIGSLSIEEDTTRADKVTPPRSRKTLETISAPIVTLTSVTYESSATVTISDVTASKWVVTAPSSIGGFDGGTEFTINYTSGWDAASIPNDILFAVSATAEALLDGGGRGVAGEGVGDYSRTMGQSEVSSSIPPVARELLLPWRRPQL